MVSSVPLAGPLVAGGTSPPGNAAAGTARARGTEFTAQGWEQAPQAGLCPLWESPAPSPACQVQAAHPAAGALAPAAPSALRRWERAATAATSACSALGNNELGVTISALVQA